MRRLGSLTVLGWCFYRKALRAGGGPKVVFPRLIRLGANVGCLVRKADYSTLYLGSVCTHLCMDCLHLNKSNHCRLGAGTSASVYFVFESF